MPRPIVEIPPISLPDGWHCDDAAPLEIDVGCHKGLFLVEMAKLYPGRNFLGVEMQADRVEKTQKKIGAFGLTNAAVVRSEGLAALKCLPKGCVDFIHVLFPDPWPKRRHYVRRLVQKEFLDESLRVLKADGTLRLVTDDESYATAMAEVAAEHPAFRKKGDEREYPQTEFQKKFLVDGRPVYSLVLGVTSRA